MSFPPECYCPVTLQVMTDPVIASDGTTYERSAIERCMAMNGLSPITRQPITSLVVNRAVKNIIERTLESLAAPSIKAEAPAELPYEPKLVCLVADCSGSMDLVCEIPDDVECGRYTRNDLMRHSLKVVCASLNSKDRVMLTRFNTQAHALCRPLLMTEDNRERIEGYIDNLYPDGQTNIWSALKVTMDTLKACSEVHGQTAHIMLFTDGESNYNNPVDGISTALRKYLAESPHFNVVIHTFGFSNSINSDLLYDIACSTRRGIFNFIPGSAMVATVFINTLAYIMSSDRPVALSQETISLSEELLAVLSQPPQTAIQELENFTARLNRINSAFAQDLYKDCAETTDNNIGQIQKALTSRYFNTWGKHYIFSVRSAFSNKMALNFKDVAVQNFKSPEFVRAQHHIQSVFETVVPPKPSHGGQALNSTEFSQTFLNQAGGCILQGTHILTPQGYVDVADIQPGEPVGTIYGIAEVKCVVKLRYTGPVYRFGKSFITGYHPVYFPTEPDQWFFPAESSRCDEILQVKDVYVYDFILTKHHVIRLGSLGKQDLYAVTLAHFMEDSEVVKHDYFGSYPVVNDLRRHSGYATGYVQLDEYQMIRGPNGRVTKIVFNEQK